MYNCICCSVEASWCDCNHIKLASTLQHIYIYIYQYDPETKAQSSVWLFADKPPSQKFIRSRNFGKQMVASCFGIDGHILTIPLVERKSVNSEWYASVCAPQVI